MGQFIMGTFEMSANTAVWFVKKAVQASFSKTPATKYFTPKRKSSIANSLRKVSAARKMTITQVVEEQDVNVVSPPRKGPVIRKSPSTKTKVNLNNSRAPAGKVVKPGKK